MNNKPIRHTEDLERYLERTGHSGIFEDQYHRCGCSSPPNSAINRTITPRVSTFTSGSPKGPVRVKPAFEVLPPKPEVLPALTISPTPVNTAAPRTVRTTTNPRSVRSNITNNNNTPPTTTTPPTNNGGNDINGTQTPTTGNTPPTTTTPGQEAQTGANDQGPSSDPAPPKKKVWIIGGVLIAALLLANMNDETKD